MIANRLRIKLTLLTTLTTLIKFTQGVLHPYCNYQLNVSDCGGPPTAVSSYWKPGSRCEIKFWRGCPTLNKFPSHYLCSHYCIGKFVDSNSIEPDDIDTNLLPPSEDPCAGKINTAYCGMEKVVYTYDEKSRSCRKVVWRGCKSDNMFSSQQTCDEMCLKFDADSFSISKKIDKLDPIQLETLNSILDDFLSQGGEEGGYNKANESKDPGGTAADPGNTTTTVDPGHTAAVDPGNTAITDPATSNVATE